MNFKTKEELHKERATFDRENLSDQYAPVDTTLLLMPFTNKGWYAHKVRQSFNKQGIGYEQFTLRNDYYMYANGDFLTIEVMNSNNGKGALMLMGGYGRIACSNGLVIGDVESGRFVHRGTRIYERLENQYEKIVAHLDKIKADVETLKNTELDSDQVLNAIDFIATQTFEVDTKKKKVEVLGYGYNTLKQLIRVRRLEDQGNDAFTIMNRVQETIVRGGYLTVKIKETNKETGEVKFRYSTKRPMEHKVRGQVEMNKLITESFLKVCA